MDRIGAIMENIELIINRLIEGNQRFIDNKSTHQTHYIHDQEMIEAQHPFVAVVSCSDSRVPPELIFDCGLGDVFVIRVAGNVIDDVAKESIAYAVHALNVKAVVVLGHTHCGAVKAACHDKDGDPSHDFVRTIMNHIKPTAQLHDNQPSQTEVAHVKNMVQLLKRDSIIGKESQIFGARYDIETGLVTWLD